MKDEHRKIEDIPAAELNGHISEFIIFVRTKDGNEYKPTSLRSLMASFRTFFKNTLWLDNTVSVLNFIGFQ